VLLISRVVLKILGLKSESITQFFSRKDLELLVREWEKSDTDDLKERSLISRLILRGHQKVREIMVPRTEMISVQASDPVSQAAILFEKTGISRFPVFDKDIDEIIGMITARDLLLDQPRTLRKIIRPVHYTPETRKIAGLLREMQELRFNLAVIVDEYGGTAGLVTIEDIIEEFFGEIFDEYDDDLDLYRNIGLKTIDVNAKANITDLNLRLALHLPEGEYVTLGGFLIEQLGHIPKPGERIDLDECNVVIRSVFRKRIRWVRLILKGDRFALPLKKS